MSSTGSVGDRPFTVLCVAGARPNFPKVKPVLDSLESRGVRTILVHTGQHYDPSMSDVFFDELGIRRPDHSLEVGSGSHAEQTARILTAFEPLVESLSPDMVLVVGDVNSTMACALVGAKAGCLVAHVEAGLRSRDWSMPEEINRVVTDRLSDHLFAPSPDAVENLLAEGYRPDQIHLVGNVMIDSLLANLERAKSRLAGLRASLELPGPFALATLHRPSNVDDSDGLDRLVSALIEVARDVPVLLPAHPRARAALQRAAAAGGDVRVIEPLGYLDFIALESQASLVLTDSGGVQEETTALGVPCLTLRDNTERPITITEGTNQLVGTDPDRIVAAARAVLVGGVPPRRPAIWDGHAADRIADVIVGHGRAPNTQRPTER
ncbi:MAG: UDP-N-acetylglucosamine 2-epimerase (non-hydrolyzing) [Actinomycetota bacterium]